jgi:hypothetical protein
MFTPSFISRLCREGVGTTANPGDGAGEKVPDVGGISASKYSFLSIMPSSYLQFPLISIFLLNAQGDDRSFARIHKK